MPWIVSQNSAWRQVSNLPSGVRNGKLETYRHAEINARHRTIGAILHPDRAFASRHKFWRSTNLDARQYPIVFFMNMAPDIIEAQDMFCDGGSRRLNDYLLSVVGHDTPAVSAYDEIGRYRPSEMPLAKGHSLGNTNRVKADVLFEYVKPMLEQERAARDR